MLGPFLELSVASADVAGSIAFYESLGFVQAPVGEAWGHPYAVVTDGRLHLGLHGTGLEAPLLTFVVQDLRGKLAQFDALGIDLATARLDDVSLHEATFQDPAGHCVRLLEARTFSPPALEPGHESALGYFEEYALGSSDPVGAGRYWENLGFVAFADESRPGKVVATSRDVNLAFHDADMASPTVCFAAPDMPARIETLRVRGHRFATRLPRALQSTGGSLLLAPDGVQILLLAAEG